MNLGIITFSSAHNYGAMLQCYALQKMTENLGFDVEIINFRPKVIDNVYNPFKRSKRSRFDLGFYKHRTILYLKHYYKIEKLKNFENFMNENLNITIPYKTFNELKEANFGYDFLISGSDQLWNPELTNGLNPSYFLKFSNDNTKKISYGVSIGSDNINKNDIPIFKHYLPNFDNISVRESSTTNVLSEYVDSSIDIVIDPTLLLERKYYDEIKNDVLNRKSLLKNDINLKNNDYIFVYTLQYNEELLKIGELISQNEKLPVIFNRPYKKFSNQLDSVPYIGPKEFLGLISNAKYIVTNSYHGVLFSIIYNKKFITIPNTNTPSRIKEVINHLNIESNLFYSFNDFKSIEDIAINYEDVEKKLSELKNDSIKFLKDSLVKNSKSDNTENLNCYLDNNDKFTCYGCYACKESCPQDAINMFEDFEGFIYPKINDKICNDCGICKSVCIFSNNKVLIEENGFPEVYASYNKNLKEREFSSSGGVFLPASRKIIEDNGYVIGAQYDKDMNVKHTIATNLEDCKKFSGSKYVRSDISDIFPKIKELIFENKPILFVGTPCQVAGLNAYLKFQNYDNLYLMEILCHSNPSPKVFRKYISYLEKKFGSKIIDFKFKDKTMGWNNPSVLIKFANGKTIRENARFNNYNRGFQTSLFARPCCYECEFVEKNRTGDITIADFWGIEKLEKDMGDDRGISLVILNNNKGKSIFESIGNELKYVKKDISSAFDKNHRFPITLNRRRYEFFEMLDKKPINDLLYSFNNVKKAHIRKKNINESKYKKLAKKILPSYVKNMLKKISGKNK